MSKGNRSRSGGIVLVGSPGQPGPPRLGLVVSKGSGNAVTRNRIKRRLRHAARELPLQPGMDYIIIASGQVSEVGYTQVQTWLDRALEGVKR
ncbi:MAG: ribonuclease P protein component [Acidimicrobiia bacterium]